LKILMNYLLIINFFIFCIEKINYFDEKKFEIFFKSRTKNITLFIEI
jgi:hypothetical protein